MGLSIRFAQSGQDTARGHHFGLIGAPQTMNPFRIAGPRQRVRYQNWLRGWLSGRQERLKTRQKGGM